MFFSHGTGHSKGVLILVKEQLDFQLQSIKVDLQGRYILLEAMIQDSPFLLLNIYASNKYSEQCEFFKTISEELNSSFTLSVFSVFTNEKLSRIGLVESPSSTFCQEAAESSSIYFSPVRHLQIFGNTSCPG